MKHKTARILRFLTPHRKRFIPLGPYCYDLIKNKEGESLYSPPKRKVCPYYIRGVHGETRCSYCDDGANALLDDMVKICGEWESYDLEEEI